MKKILIANRGEIAVRIIRACQELGLKTVAIHSVADKDSLHVKIADESICIGPGSSAMSYLNIPKIMSAVEISGVDAVHPGYGFLAENEDFAQICLKYNVKFIGPSPQHIALLGNKVEARKIAKKVGVPLLPGSEGEVKTFEEAKKIATEIGFPLIIKAAAGGGGRGMKIIRELSDLELQFKIAQQEALNYFADSAVFIEKYCENPRHVEVQIMGDEHGNYIHVGERDCSIQRRHQKLIEESPCPVFNEQQRQQIGEAALKLIREVGYSSLGTVEFLFNEDGSFYFMEVNTRIQVEHPVSELTSGLDLVKEQILIAMGNKISYKQEDIKLRGHAIECRINAEDPETFVPSPGTVNAYHVPGGPGIRVDSMLYTGYTVPSLYDSMVAKLLAYGKNREESITRMKRALNEMKIDGIKTNIPFHLKIMDDENFRSGNISTKFLETYYYKNHKTVLK